MYDCFFFFLRCFFLIFDAIYTYYIYILDTTTADRKFDCDCLWNLEKRVLQPLIDGATVMVTNKYTFELSLDNEATLACPSTGDCFIYIMEQHNSITDFIESSSNTNIECPTDGISDCYIITTHNYGAALSIIDARQSHMLLLLGLKRKHSFAYSTIYAPENGILYIESGMASFPFTHATFYAQRSEMVIMERISRAAVSASFYLNPSGLTQFNCDYYNQCKDINLYINIGSIFFFDINSIIHDNLCLYCDDPACSGMSLFITDTTNDETYRFDAEEIGNNDWYWVNNSSNVSVKFSDSQTEVYCPRLTEQKLNRSWYEQPYCYSMDQVNECNWISIIGNGVTDNSWKAEPIMGQQFCFTDLYRDTDYLYSYKTECDDCVPQLDYYWGKGNCNDSDSLDVIKAEAGGAVQGECDNGSGLCGFVTFIVRVYDNDTGTCNDDDYLVTWKGAEFVNRCNGDGQKYSCIDDGTTLKLETYDECSGELIDIELFTEGECNGEYFYQQIDCSFATS